MFNTKVCDSGEQLCISYLQMIINVLFILKIDILLTVKIQRFFYVINFHQIGPEQQQETALLGLYNIFKLCNSTLTCVPVESTVLTLPKSLTKGTSFLRTTTKISII